MTQQTDTPTVEVSQDDHGFCVGCNQPIQIGQVLTVWDEETGHADCDRPFDLGHQHPADADWPLPVVLLGHPATYHPLSQLSADLRQAMEGAEELNEFQVIVPKALWANAMRALSTHQPQTDAGEAVLEARPLDEWHEDMGDVVWWKFPIEEPAMIGNPLDSAWPGYHTHWTPHPAIPVIRQQAEAQGDGYEGEGRDWAEHVEAQGDGA